MLFTLKDVVVLFSGFLGLLLAVVLLYRHTCNQRPNRLLAAFLILQSLALLVTVLFYGQHVRGLKWITLSLYYIESALLLLEGFILYWYCKALLFKEPSSSVFFLRHTVFLAALFMSASYFYVGEDILGYMNLKAENRSTSAGFGYLTMHLVRFGYGVLCLDLLRRYKKRMAQRYSNMRKQDFSWLAWLLLAFLLVRGGWLLVNFYSVFLVLPSWDFSWLKPMVKTIYPLLDISWFVAHLALLFFGLRYASSFESLSSEPDSKASLKLPANYEALVKRLESHMTSQRSYMAPDFKLDELAAEVSIPLKTLSAMINQHFKTNFCGFVNQYRINDAVQKLSQHDALNQNVIDIAYSVGFNSKSTFNRAFKQQMGCTPVDYRKRHG